MLSTVVAIDGEDYVENDVTINGIYGKLYEYNKIGDISYCAIVWTDNRYFYQLRCYLSKEETLKIAESVKLQAMEE